MPVVNHYKRARAKGAQVKVPTRKKFIGDPALMPFTHNPTRLEGCRKNKPDYEANKERRRFMSSTADRSVPVHKGPTKREKGISREEWKKIMTGRK